MMNKSAFALFFGNRGFFPASLQAEAREELPKVLRAAGHEVLMLDAEATRYGAVETPREGQVFYNFLQENRGKFDGVILAVAHDIFGGAGREITLDKLATIMSSSPVLVDVKRYFDGNKALGKGFQLRAAGPAGPLPGTTSVCRELCPKSWRSHFQCIDQRSRGSRTFRHTQGGGSFQPGD